MNILEKIELNFIFKIARLIALFFITLAALSILVLLGVSIYEANEKSIRISESQIEALTRPSLAAKNSPESRGSVSDREKDVSVIPQSLPFALEKHIAHPDNRRVLNNWLTALEEKDRAGFIDELELQIAKSEQYDTDTAADLNRLWALKLEKLQERDRQGHSPMEYAVYGAVLVSAAITIALFACVLILLRIETNTRILKNER